MEVILVLVLRESIDFSGRYAQNDFQMSVLVTLIFSLLLCQLLLTWVTSRQSLNIVPCSVFELTVGTEQTDRQTEGCKAAPRGGPRNSRILYIHSRQRSQPSETFPAPNRCPLPVTHHAVAWADFTPGQYFRCMNIS